MITGQPESLLTEIVGNSRTLGQDKLDKRESGIFWLLWIATRQSQPMLQQMNSVNSHPRLSW